MENCGEPIAQCGPAINLLITQMQSELFVSLLQISFPSQHEPGLDYGLWECRGESRRGVWVRHGVVTTSDLQTEKSIYCHMSSSGSR